MGYYNGILDGGGGGQGRRCRLEKRCVARRDVELKLPLLARGTHRNISHDTRVAWQLRSIMAILTNNRTAIRLSSRRFARPKISLS